MKLKNMSLYFISKSFESMVGISKLLILFPSTRSYQFVGKKEQFRNLVLELDNSLEATAYV